MSRPLRQLLACSFVAFTVVAGCTIVAQTDRSRIDEDNPGSGGMMPDMGGSNGSGGEGTGGADSPTGGIGGETNMAGSDPGGSSGSSN